MAVVETVAETAASGFDMIPKVEVVPLRWSAEWHTAAEAAGFENLVFSDL